MSVPAKVQAIEALIEAHAVEGSNSRRSAGGFGGFAQRPVTSKPRPRTWPRCWRPRSPSQPSAASDGG